MVTARDALGPACGSDYGAADAAPVFASTSTVCVTAPLVPTSYVTLQTKGLTVVGPVAFGMKVTSLMAHNDGVVFVPPVARAFKYAWSLSIFHDSVPGTDAHSPALRPATPTLAGAEARPLSTYTANILSLLGEPNRYAQTGVAVGVTGRAVWTRSSFASGAAVDSAERAVTSADLAVGPGGGVTADLAPHPGRATSANARAVARANLEDRAIRAGIMDARFRRAAVE
jgi:hypothetical protein